MKISIIVPVYNEVNTITLVLNKLNDLKFPYRLQKEIIVVDDGSNDGTINKIKGFKKSELTLLKHANNRGKGAALRTGFENATGDIITIQDADLEYDPNDFKRLVKPIIDKRAKVVYGNRFANYPLRFWGEDKTIMPSHWIGNRLLTIITNIVYGVWLNDMETCYKLITRDVLQKLSLKSDGFDIEPELTAKILKKRIKIVEIPIIVKPRTHQEGKKISWKDGFGAIWALIKYRFTN